MFQFKSIHIGLIRRFVFLISIVINGVMIYFFFLSLLEYVVTLIDMINKK